MREGVCQQRGVSQDEGGGTQAVRTALQRRYESSDSFGNLSPGFSWRGRQRPINGTGTGCVKPGRMKSASGPTYNHGECANHDFEIQPQTPVVHVESVESDVLFKGWVLL